MRWRRFGALVADGRLERDGAAYRPVGELGELTIPDTLRSLIASRLDALEPADRSLVADAAVLGQSFTLAGLTALNGIDRETLEPRLRLLVRRELFDLEVDPRSPERGQYRFVQSLIREVAHGRLARRERRARHLAAARYFEALGEDELAGALASHYVAAHEASAEGAEADAVAIQARLALSGAAERAATLGAHDEAVAYLQAAIAITADPAERCELLLRAARSANAAARHVDAETLVREAIELALATDHAPSVGSGRALLGEILIDSGRAPEAVAVLKAAIAAFPETDSEEVRAGLLANLSRALMRSGQLARAVEAADLALDLAEHLGLHRIIAEAFNNKGSALGYLGRKLESLALLRAAVEVARDGGFVAAETRALSNLGAMTDDPRRSRDLSQMALELALRVGNRGHAAWARENVRLAAYELAEGWDEALAAPTDALDHGGGDVGSRFGEIRSLSTSALFVAARGESIDAIIDRLEALSTEVSDASAQSMLHGLRSARALGAGDYARSCDEAIEAADVDEQLSDAYLAEAMRPALWGRDLPRARRVADRLDADPSTRLSTAADRIAARAGIAALEGRRDEAVAGYREALSRKRALGADWSVALTALDFVIMVGADHPAAREAAGEARTIFERVRARAYLERLDAALAARASALTASGERR
ncbi:MAG TPA: hypothetical protein VLH81_01620, partial [Desulfobacterales bacterium]|nr:hypothetical protein [Desulfobacterales bacterium]